MSIFARTLLVLQVSAVVAQGKRAFAWVVRNAREAFMRKLDSPGRVVTRDLSRNVIAGEEEGGTDGNNELESRGFLIG